MVCLMKIHPLICIQCRTIWAAWKINLSLYMTVFSCLKKEVKNLSSLHIGIPVWIYWKENKFCSKSWKQYLWINMEIYLIIPWHYFLISWIILEALISLKVRHKYKFFHVSFPQILSFKFCFLCYGIKGNFSALHRFIYLTLQFL